MFQTRGAATKNARSPIVVRHEDGVTRADVDEDRSLFLVSTSATRRSSLARYGGAVPCRHRKTRTESLNSIRSGTRSQWRSRSSGVMWSYFRAVLAYCLTISTHCRHSTDLVFSCTLKWRTCQVGYETLLYIYVWDGCVMWLLCVLCPLDVSHASELLN